MLAPNWDETSTKKSTTHDAARFAHDTHTRGFIHTSQQLDVASDGGTCYGDHPCHGPRHTTTKRNQQNFVKRLLRISYNLFLLSSNLFFFYLQTSGLRLLTSLTAPQEQNLVLAKRARSDSEPGFRKQPLSRTRCARRTGSLSGPVLV